MNGRAEYPRPCAVVPGVNELRQAREMWSNDARRMDPGPQSSATRLAVLVADLCDLRHVSPRLTEGILDVPAPREVDYEQVMTAGPIVVRCEFMCFTVNRAQEICNEALKATTFCPGWEGMFLDLMRPHCARQGLAVVP